MKRPPISACIITFNEENAISDCLESLMWVEEIVVVDSMSQDSTVSLCREYTDIIIQKNWEGHVKQKNYALSQATNEWVLCLDADERVTPELRQEIERCLSEEADSVDGYYFPRHSYYLGRWINHGGWFPDYKLRLFKKEKAYFGDNDPHDKVEIEGQTKKLKNGIIHYTYRDLAHQIDTINSFSETGAKF